MGEIAEALKRAREEREARKSTEPSRRPAPPAPPPLAHEDLLEVEPEPPPVEPKEPASVGVGTTTADALGVSRASAAPAPAPLVPEPDEAEIHLESFSEESLETFGKPELHRHLALQVAGRLESQGRRSLAVVSALRDEGKTTVACTLAMALSSVTARRSVALVDLDMRNPSVARRLGLPVRRGVEQYLLGQASLDEIRVSVGTPLLDVYPSVEPQRTAHELLAGSRIGALVSELEQHYDTVILDTPPTLIVPDSSMLLRHVSACLPVARMGVSRVRRVEEMLELLPTPAVLGKVINGALLPNKDSSYYEYSYGPEHHDDEPAADAESEAKAE